MFSSDFWNSFRILWKPFQNIYVCKYIIGRSTQVQNQNSKGILTTKHRNPYFHKNNAHHHTDISTSFGLWPKISKCHEMRKKSWNLVYILAKECIISSFNLTIFRFWFLVRYLQNFLIFKWSLHFTWNIF